jgi:hypothetical protein
MVSEAAAGLYFEPRGEMLYLASRRAMNKRQIRQTGDYENAGAGYRQQPKNDPPSQSTPHSLLLG